MVRAKTSIEFSMSFVLFPFECDIVCQRLWVYSILAGCRGLLFQFSLELIFFKGLFQAVPDVGHPVIGVPVMR